MFSRGGELLIYSGDVEQWKVQSKELLNPTNMSSVGEVESEDLGEVFPIFLIEVAEVIKKCVGGKMQDVDDISPEMLKTLYIVGLAWLTPLLSVVWWLGTVGVQWHNGVGVLISKKAEQWVCSSFPGVALLSLPL